jgi:glutamine cyclotransferase
MDYKLAVLCLFLCATFCYGSDYKILETQNHGRHIFTQGLEMSENELFISSGLYKKSFLEVQNSNGKTIRKKALPPFIFAEGVTIFKGDLFLLTWRAGYVLTIDPLTFQQKNSFKYTGEGWGLTHDKKHLIRSDGTHRIYFHSPKDFSLKRHIDVTYQGQKLDKLNELEFVDGDIWANVWQSDKILKIDAKTGQVLQAFDMTELIGLSGASGADSVLNGIAYDRQAKAFWVTGKNWPYRFLVEFDSN